VSIRAALLLLLLLAGCAPRQMPPGPGASAPALQIEAHGMETLRTADGLALPMEVWRPDGKAKAAVVALHGFNDYANAFAMPGPWFASQGIALYAFDQRSFGRTPNPGLWAGTGALAEDLRTALRLVGARHPGVPLYALGDSMGGAVVLAALAAEPLPELTGAILVAPAARGRAAMPAYQRAALWLTAHTVPWLHLTPDGLDILPSDNRPMLRALSADPLVQKGSRVDALWGLVDLMDAALEAAPDLRLRALFLYGRRDEVIPPPGVKLLLERLPRENLTVALYSEGYHMLLRDLQREVVWRDVLAWIESAPLPSGADRGPPLADKPLPRR
jgi:acylglycerol lipase